MSDVKVITVEIKENPIYCDSDEALLNRIFGSNVSFHDNDQKSFKRHVDYNIFKHDINIHDLFELVDNFEVILCDSYMSIE